VLCTAIGVLWITLGVLVYSHGCFVYSGVIQNMATDQSVQLTQPVDDIIDRQANYSAGSGSVPAVDDVISECDMLTMSACQLAADFELPQPSLSTASVHTDHSQNCSSGGTILFMGFLLCIYVCLIICRLSVHLSCT